MTGLTNLPLVVSQFPTAMPEGKALGDMEQKTWGDLRDMLSIRREGQKDGPNLVFARFKLETVKPPHGKATQQIVRRLKANLEARTAIALDVDGNKETGEVAPALHDISQRIIAQGWGALFYTSHSHSAAAPRYRIVLPLNAEIPPHLPAVEAVAEILGLSGVLDKSKLGASSVFYLPSSEPGKQADHHTGEIEGNAINAAWIVERTGAILAERDCAQAEIRAAAMAESERRRAAKLAAGFKPTDKLIDGIRDRLDFTGELLRHGYVQKGDRFLFSGSETGIPGVHVLRGSDGIERVYSHHSGDPLAACNLPPWCTVKAVDAVDVVAILDFGGDFTKALHDMATRFGIGEPLRAKAPPAEPPGFDDIPPPEDDGSPSGDEPNTGKPGGEQKKARDEKRAGWAKTYVLTPAECAARPHREYVVKGLLSRADHGGLIGLPGSAKSALAPYVGYRVSLGLDVFGRRTRAVPVLYLAAEDGTGMTMRVRALHDRMGNAPNFFLQPVPIDLLNSDSPHMSQILLHIEEIKPGLIILDTISRAFPGLRENDPDEMGRVVQVARGFTTICNSAVLSLHHPPKDSVTPRGHSVLNGDFDVTLFLEGARNEERRITMGKNRNGPSDLSFGFNVAVHTFPEPDEDGDPITAPVAEPVEGYSKPAARLTPLEKNAVAFLADLLCDEGKPLPTRPGFAPHLNDVEEQRWRDICDTRRLSMAESRDDRKRVFRNVSQALRNKQVIGLCDGLVWLTERL